MRHCYRCGVRLFSPLEVSVCLICAAGGPIVVGGENGHEPGVPLTVDEADRAHARSTS